MTGFERLPAALAPRFWAQVEVAGSDDCWPWVGGHFALGYGGVRISPRKNHTLKAHRVAFALAFAGGYVPPAAILVCHRCDNPPCCNPVHLFFGTSSDNSVDREAKGRRCTAIRPGRSRGERNPAAVLNEATVREIRRTAAASGERHADIARRFGVARPTVSQLLRGETWAHVEAVPA